MSHTDQQSALFTDSMLDQFLFFISVYLSVCGQVTLEWPVHLPSSSSSRHIIRAYRGKGWHTLSVSCSEIVVYSFVIFSSAGWAVDISWSECCLSVCLCLDVNQAGTSHSRCTQRLVNLPAQTVVPSQFSVPQCVTLALFLAVVWPWQIKLSLYGSQLLPAEKLDMNTHFQACWASQSVGRLFWISFQWTLIKLCFIVSSIFDFVNWETNIP